MLVCRYNREHCRQWCKGGITLNTPSRSPAFRGPAITLPQELKQRLLDMIEAGGLGEGHRLPTEAELCKRFGVSRTVLREAMKYLELLGIVSIEPGRGTFVKAFDVRNLFSIIPAQLMFKPQDIAEVLQTRQLLEGFCLEQAIIKGGAEGLRELEACVEELRLGLDVHAPIASMEADIDFHRALATMAGAKLLLVILEIFWGLRGKLPLSDDSREAREKRYTRHLRLYEAIEQRDLQFARLCLAEHFAGGYEEIIAARSREIRARD